MNFLLLTDSETMKNSISSLFQRYLCRKKSLRLKMHSNEMTYNIFRFKWQRAFPHSSIRFPFVHPFSPARIIEAYGGAFNAFLPRFTCGRPDKHIVIRDCRVKVQLMNCFEELMLPSTDDLNSVSLTPVISEYVIDGQDIFFKEAFIYKCPHEEASHSFQLT